MSQYGPTPIEGNNLLIKERPPIPPKERPPIPPPLGSDGRRRSRHVRTRNNVIEFMVQYELKIGDEWYPVVRYDTAHGFAHKDILSYKGNAEKERIPFNNFNLALTFAENDLRNNWENYRNNFLREVKENE
jgi:hypothetical protein